MVQKRTSSCVALLFLSVVELVWNWWSTHNYSWNCKIPDRFNCTDSIPKPWHNRMMLHRRD